MKRKNKLGSLFDGSGGFPLSGSLCGIEPVWAAEVEPYPIAVTRSRFPNMRHLGDISKVNGAEIEPVDIITFGSPCQDLSVAGKRAGLKHEANGDEETTRSGLFMEAVRIIKEMREATGGQYPRFALWENVPGAFSSQKGEDFRVVLEELIRIIEPGAVMPTVPKAGWSYADSYTGDGWSIAYRVFDAQYWGVPQRRRRIHLVVDFRGQCAREVLFEREGVRGHFAQSRTPWQATAAYARGSSGADDREGEGADGADHGGAGGRQLAAVAFADVAATLRAGAGAPKHEADFVGRLVAEPVCMATQQGGAEIRTDDKAPTITAAAGMSGNNQPVIAFAQNQRDEVRDLGDKAGALQAQPGMKQQTFIIDSIGGQAERDWEGEVAPTLKATHFKCAPVVTVPAAGFCSEQSAKTRGIGYEDEMSPTLRAGVIPAVVYDARGNGDGKTVNTLTGDHNDRITDYSSVVVEGGPVYCLQGNGIDRADTAGCNGKGWKEDTSYTLNTIDRPAVAYAETYQKVTGPLMANSHPGSYSGQDAYSDMLIVGREQPVCYRQGGFAQYAEPILVADHPTPKIDGSGVAYTLNARDYKAPLCTAYLAPEKETVGTLMANAARYIVRRLTPTECARLQGFADRWGDIDWKDSFTDEEYRFWLEVRNTHAAINGKQVKDYTEAQMLTWYNKLHTDSAEYKMWGNGIALPTALYVMQGIADVLNRQRKADKAPSSGLGRRI